MCACVCGRTKAHRSGRLGGGVICNMVQCEFVCVQAGGRELFKEQTI